MLVFQQRSTVFECARNMAYEILFCFLLYSPLCCDATPRTFSLECGSGSWLGTIKDGDVGGVEIDGCDAEAGLPVEGQSNSHGMFCSIF